MKRFLFIATLVAMAANAWAYEYVFDMSKALELNNSTSANIIRLQVPAISDPSKKVTLSFTFNTASDVEKCYIDEQGRLVVPVPPQASSATKISAQCLSEGINEVWLGTIPSVNGGIPDYEFGNEERGIDDWKVPEGGHGRDMDNVFIAGRSSAYTPYSSRKTFYVSCTPTIRPNNANDAKMYHIGRYVTVRTEPITLEDLTFADHNVKGQYHTIADDLVGVQVIDRPSYNGGKMLIARSANPISPAHKHGVQPGQDILHDDNGNIPAWADPATVQYAWIGLTLPNPDQYVGKQLRGVRGMYCNTFYNRGFHTVDWFNPIMDVVDAEIEVVAEGVTTTLNTYCVANMSEQDNNRFFLMEPRLLEPCNITDVMRTADEAIYAPTENALMPEGAINYYHRDGIEGSGMLAGKYGKLWDFGAVWHDVDEMYGGSAYAWRTYNKVFNINDALIIAWDESQINKTGYHYPLDTPNFDYESTENVGMALFGTAQTTIRVEDYSDDDFAMADADYFSRYSYAADCNVYKNDLHVMVNRLNMNFDGIRDLVVTRCNSRGDELADIATLLYQGEGKYKVKYNLETQTSRGNDLIKVSHNSSAPRRAAATGEYLGDNHFADESIVYNLENGKDNYIYLSDMFCGDPMLDIDGVENKTTAYTYRIKAGEGTTRDVTCVLNAVPIYTPHDYILSRARYTAEQVAGDITGELHPLDFVEANFDIRRSYSVDGWTVMRDYDHDFMAGRTDIHINHDEITSNYLELSEFCEIANPEDHEYVPELKTDYNNNTYGCFKQSVKNTEVTMSCVGKVASIKTTEDGEKYFHADLSVVSQIIEQAQKLTTSKDLRYLFRVWRLEDGKDPVLLNTTGNFDEEHVLDMNPHWETNYHMLDGVALSESLNNNADEFTISDTFKAKVGSNNAGAPRRAQGDVYSCDYKVSLYVLDENTGRYYVRTNTIPVSWDASVVTAITDLVTNDAQVTNVRYINMAGVESATPFQGVNMVVTTYSNGNTTVAKVVK